MLKVEFNKKATSLVITLFITAILLLGLSNLSSLAISGIILTLYIFINLLFGFGEGVPVNLVISFLASLQWIIGPILSYYSGINHPFYKMHVPEEQYFIYIIPGVFLYYIGLSIPILQVENIPKIKLNELEQATSDKSKGAYYLIGFGFLASFVSPFMPPFLYFILYLLSQLKYIGCFYLYLSKSRNNVILYLVFATLVLEVLASTIFHDLLLWVLFFLFIYCIKNYVSFKKKITVVFVGLFLLLVLQSVKYQYRTIAWSNASLGTFARTELFVDMILAILKSPDQLFESKKNELTITRLNQGWIIARVMNYVPYNQPFAKGETIKNAFSASLLPRFLVESKGTAGGRENMEKFTGIELQAGTSMNISLIGEGYANYGKSGGMLFMLCIGLLFSIILRVVLIKSKENPTLIIWIPFLFLQVVKAETDLITTLNYLVKASIIMILIFWSFKKIFKVEI